MMESSGADPIGRPNSASAGRAPGQDGAAPAGERRAVPDRRNTDRRSMAGLFIHRPIIRRYCIIVLAILMTASILVGIVIHQTIKQALEKEAARVYKVSVYEALMEVNNQLLVRTFLILLLSVIVTAVAGILFLHRITGPVYRIRRVIQHLNEGKIPERNITLREGDYFAEVMEDLNKLVAKLRGSPLR